MMLRNFTIACVVVAVGFVGLQAVPASALSIDDVQAQIAKLVAQIQDLTAQLTQLRTQAGQSDGSGVWPVPMPIPSNKHRICEVLYRNLSQGVQGDDVRAMQEFLHEQGYLSANATGYYGPLTAQAVATWQSSEGVSAVGSFGPMSRERIRIWCGNPQPTCRPLNYMPVACADGSQPQPVQNERGCTIRYECPVANFVPPANCKAWNDGCNICSRQTPDSPAMCTMRACLATTNNIWAGKGYCTAYFDNSGNKPPVISGFSGPTVLAVNQRGTWSVNASDPENGTLSYSVMWGDEHQPPSTGTEIMTAAVYVQTTTFTHAYSSAGVYTVSIIVQDSSGQSARTSTTVQVGGGVTACTMEYAPVCGQPPPPACSRWAQPCPYAQPTPKTYSNRCTMNADGATFLYEGACRGSLNGSMTIGPICPVETNPPQPQCTPTAATYAAHRIFVYTSDGATRITTATADNGYYSIPLSAGDYKVQIEGSGSCAAEPGGYNYLCFAMSAVPRDTLIPVHIYEGGAATLNINIDTGIR